MKNSAVLFSLFLSYSAGATEARYLKASTSKDAKCSGLDTCEQETFAFCGVSPCKVFNGVAYCTCEIVDTVGTGSSFVDHSDGNQDICALNEDAVENDLGHMFTFYPWDYSSKVAYQCENSAAPYAQCDGGICFNSSTGSTFLGNPVGKDEIVCACPVVYAPTNGTHNFLYGPPSSADETKCYNEQYDYCFNEYKNNKIPTGSSIYVGAPQSTMNILADCNPDPGTPPTNCICDASEGKSSCGVSGSSSGSKQSKQKKNGKKKNGGGKQKKQGGKKKQD